MHERRMEVNFVCLPIGNWDWKLDSCWLDIHVWHGPLLNRKFQKG